MDDYVPVIDLTFVTTVKDVTLVYTVRPHKGDEFKALEAGWVITFGPAEVVLPNGMKTTVPGDQKTIFAHNIIEVTNRIRYEPRVRPKASDYMKSAAERLLRDLENSTGKGE